MKKLFAFLCVLTVLITCIPLRANALSAAAYVLLERTGGRVLYAHNENKRLPMASTTKVMTALLVIEQMELDTEYTIPDEAVGIPGSSIYLQKGEKLTGRELLYGLMLASGNDAAYALAILTSGSSEAFVCRMNARARELGLDDTRFSDPCGLASKNHYTTALDLARLCAYALAHPLFAEVVSTQNKQIRGAKEGTVRYLHNKNRVLGEVQGGDGVKTGYTTAAGRCLCSSATRGGMQLVCVVLNDHDWFADSKSLLEKGFKTFHLEKIAEKGEKAGECKIVDGKREKCDIIISKDVFYPLADGETVKRAPAVPESLAAPVQKGQKAGEIAFLLGETEIARVPCVLAQAAEKKFTFFGGKT